MSISPSDIENYNTPMGAVFSECRQHRFLLWRRWSSQPHVCMFVGLNPSTATETTDDPTVRRCIDFAKRWGFAGMFMMNAFSFRATDPRNMKNAAFPNLPDNDSWLESVAEWPEVGRRVVCWGNHGTFQNRAEVVAWLLEDFDVKCLGITKSGQPKHPLYLAKNSEVIDYEYDMLPPV